jgi:hypothetical protein
MPPLFPPDYPERPDMPLLSFGPSFSEEISRSVIGAVRHDDQERPHETDVRIAGSLTMFEAFHPRDQLECMMAAQGVAMHAAIMDNLERAMQPDTALAMTVKLRANSVQLGRAFSVVAQTLERRQTKPLAQRPAPSPDRPPAAPPRTPDPGDSPGVAPPGDSPGSSPPGDIPSEPPTSAMPAADPAAEPALPEDLVTRPDGTPGTLAAYAPKPPTRVFIPREAPIMVALATRPKPWRQVNLPGAGDPTGEPAAAAPAVTTNAAAAVQPTRLATRGPLDARERIFTGDGLSRFAATRLDPGTPFPGTPVPGAQADAEPDDEATFELEMISTGGDPGSEAERAAMMAAHPEGKPIVTFRYGSRKPPEEPPRDQ